MEANTLQKSTNVLLDHYCNVKNSKKLENLRGNGGTRKQNLCAAFSLGAITCVWKIGLNQFNVYLLFYNLFKKLLGLPNAFLWYQSVMSTLNTVHITDSYITSSNYSYLRLCKWNSTHISRSLLTIFDFLQQWLGSETCNE